MVEQENPSYVHGVHPKPINPNRIEIYIPAKHQATVAEIREALEKDGSSLSNFFMEKMLAWWERHKPGNPQLSLERYDDSNPQPGPNIPGSIYYRDRQEIWHWGWLHQLPYGRLQWVDHEGKAHWVLFPEALS